MVERIRIDLLSCQVQVTAVALGHPLERGRGFVSVAAELPKRQAPSQSAVGIEAGDDRRMQGRTVLADEIDARLLPDGDADRLLGLGRSPERLDQPSRR